MNNIKSRMLALLLLAGGATAGMYGALTQSFYASSSVLSEGLWVKVGVDQTGVYEIPYSTLREMGFANPEAVSVYGRGGRTLSESFVSNAGVPVLTDDLAPVKVIHENDRIYFYGLGPEEIIFETSTAYGLGGYFQRKSNNIYTRRGYYFLTDTRDVAKMAEVANDVSAAATLETGVSFIYHELDSVQNTTQTGQLFWGERVGPPGAERRLWDVTMPDAIAGSKGVMHCEIYLPDYNMGTGATVSYGFDGTADYFSTPFVPNKSLYYAPHEPKVAEVGVPGAKGKVFVGFKAADMSNFANLDFWVVSYERKVPTLKGADGESLNQQLAAFPSLAKGTTGKLELSDAASFVVLDVTNPAEPQRLRLTQQGPVSTAGVKYGTKVPVIVVFDKTRPQLQISGYETDYSRIENQNLHSYKTKGADFVIISTPSLRPYAEEIANLHRSHDGIEVVVATTDECYNEFSGGVPDPMAYRSFVRMLYFSDRKPKNLLLLGPLYGDFRGLLSEHNPSEGIIAFQSPLVSTSRGAHNINDFYGMMDDKFRTDYYERNSVQVGVGILPIKFESEARIMVEKLRHYMERTDHAYYLNRYTAIGGLGDNHTHDAQVKEINDHIRTLDNFGTIFTPLQIDAYGNEEAHKKFVSQLNEGCSMFSYFGHGAEQFMGLNRYFFNAGDVYKLRNAVHPLALFGGCLITNSDRGFRGLGETIVTNTPYGAIGSIVSARDTWSGQNLEFFKQFFSCLYKQGNGDGTPHNTDPVTLGEVYARVKHYSTYSNELAYQLLSDPALIYPIINQSIDVQTNMGDSKQITPGEKFSFKGTVVNPQGQTDTSFNGELVLRINEPEVTVLAGNVQTGEDPDGLTFTYRDSQITMSVAQVKNGSFTVDFHAPQSISGFSGKQVLLYFTAYDPTTKKGAGAAYKIFVGNESAGSTETADRIAPKIEEFSFNPDDCSISLTVSDNLALNLSKSPLSKGLFLYIDGRERSEAHFVEPVMEQGRPAYSKNVLIDGLRYGTHSARLKVKDAAGNSAETEFLFTYQPGAAKYVIERDLTSSATATRIALTSAETPAQATLIILSSEGNQVWSADFKGGAAEWNHTDSTGAKVKPGHYKAYIIERGSGDFKGHSDTIDIPVI
ncbi:MAG: hypothetical protein J1F07_09800 [Muribaculaceae bacterium]|nr:hypothetical protein [Muribaculaceae bacterium]